MSSNKKYKLLDIGAGEHLIKKFLPKNIKYISIDSIGKQNYNINLNSNKLPFKDKSFDIILCLETLEHILSPHNLMNEILRISKNNSLFLLSMPNEYNFYCRINFLFGRKTEVQKPFKIVDDSQHIHLPRVKDILNFFKEYIHINKIDYRGYSRSSEHKKDIIFLKIIDKILDYLSRIYPSLFARTVIIKGFKK